MDAIKGVLTPEKYQEFVDVFRDLGNEKQSINETVKRVCAILEGHEDIQQQFLYLVHLRNREGDAGFTENQYMANPQDPAYLHQSIPPFLPSFPPLPPPHTGSSLHPDSIPSSSIATFNLPLPQPTTTPGAPSYPFPIIPPSLPPADSTPSYIHPAPAHTSVPMSVPIPVPVPTSAPSSFHAHAEHAHSTRHDLHSRPPTTGRRGSIHHNGTSSKRHCPGGTSDHAPLMAGSHEGVGRSMGQSISLNSIRVCGGDYSYTMLLRVLLLFEKEIISLAEVLTLIQQIYAKKEEVYQMLLSYFVQQGINAKDVC